MIFDDRQTKKWIDARINHFYRSVLMIIIDLVKI